jgi:hypothetical protein
MHVHKKGSWNTWSIKHKNESNTIKYGTSNIRACESDGVSILKKHT